ncbi:MAG: hypothetical protein ACM35G_11775 [Planctomycetaceae bacterium]
METSSWLWGCTDASEAIALAERFARGRDVLAADAARAAARAGACAAKAGALADRAADAEADPSASYRAVAANTAAAHAAQTIVTASGAPNAAHAAARAATYIDRRIHDATAADLRQLLELDLGRFPELGAVIDPGEDGPLGPLWPTHAHGISGGAVFAHPHTPR